MINLGGGTKYPRFYKITNKAAKAITKRNETAFADMIGAYKELEGDLDAEAIFLRNGNRLEFGGYKLKDFYNRDDKEAWLLPDRRNGHSTLRKRKSKKWSDAAQAVWDKYTPLLEELAKDHPYITQNSFLAPLNISNDMMMFGGYRAIMGERDTTGAFYLSIHFDIPEDVEGVEKITCEEFEAIVERNE